MQLHPPPEPAGPTETVPVTAPTPARAGRDEEFTAFMTAAAPALLRTAWLLVGDAHRAEELTQHAFVRTYTAWPRVRDGNPTAYARRVLVNLRTDTWRRRRREVLAPPAELPDLAAPQETTTEDRDQLHRALQRLTPRQRRVVVLRYLVGLTEQEVADDLRVRVGTVKSTSSRALAALRESMTDASTGSTS